MLVPELSTVQLQDPGHTGHLGALVPGAVEVDQDPFDVHAHVVVGVQVLVLKLCQQLLPRI